VKGMPTWTYSTQRRGSPEGENDGSGSKSVEEPMTGHTRTRGQVGGGGAHALLAKEEGR
jgi:hypothetical protein